MKMERNRFIRFFYKILNLFNLGHKKGIIEFTTGNYEVFIKVHIGHEEKVWVHFGKSLDPCCSYLEGDLFDIKETKGGFIIVAKVESNNRKVYWYIK